MLVPRTIKFNHLLYFHALILRKYHGNKALKLLLCLLLFSLKTNDIDLFAQWDLLAKSEQWKHQSNL